MAEIEKKNPWLDEGSKYDEQEKQKKRDIKDMKFQDSTTHTTRVLPAKNPNDVPYYAYKQHWIPQNGTTLSKPITHGIDERCSVCEWVSIQWDEIHRLKEEEDMTDKSPEVEALLTKQGKVAAKSRYDMNIIHREDCFITNTETGEKKLVSKRMAAVPTVYKEIFSFAKKWGSPSNEKTGYDLDIITSGTKERREYRVVPNRDASPLTAEEVKLLETMCDLKALRKNTPISEVRKILENAKAPYNEILSHMGEDKGEASAAASKPADKHDEVEKEIEKEIAKPETKAAETKTPVKEEPKKAEVKAEPKAETKAAEPKAETKVDDEHNIEVYECKGDFDENDKMCSDCPVREKCEEVHPFYVKAKQQGVNVDPHRSTQDVVNDVKKTETPESSTPRRGKKIPF
jgi:hypothetical protein